MTAFEMIDEAIRIMKTANVLTPKDKDRIVYLIRSAMEIDPDLNHAIHQALKSFD